MIGIDTLRARLLVACVFGVGVAGIAIYLVPASTDVYLYPQQATRRHIESTVRALDDFKAKHGIFPATLAAVNPDYVRPDKWGRPLRYSLSGGKPLVESFGRDGVRGGVGLDADLSNQVPHPAEEKMPISQKLTHPWAQGMIVVALICGVLAGGLVFHGLSNEGTRPQSWVGFGISVVIAFVMATYGAILITVVHAPSGH